MTTDAGAPAAGRLEGMLEGGALPTPLERARGALARVVARAPAWVQVALSGRPPIRRDGAALDPTLQLLLAARGSVGPDPLTQGTPAEARARLRRDVLSVRGPLTEVGAVAEVTVAGAAGPLRARHYAPAVGATAAAPPLLVFLHGGGFMLGDLDTHDEACRLLCRHARQHVLSVAYRLAPEHPFPAGMDDAVASFRWAQAHAGALGADPSCVSVGGDSAGGNLAAVVGQLTARDRPPAAQLLIYPPMDVITPRPSHALFEGFFLRTADRRAFFENYAARVGIRGDDPRVSPLKAGSLTGLPPALVVTAGFDVLRDEGEAYAAALLDAGTPCELHREPTLGHGFVHLTGVCAAARRATVSLAERWRAMVPCATVTA